MAWQLRHGSVKKMIFMWATRSSTSKLLTYFQFLLCYTNTSLLLLWAFSTFWEFPKVINCQALQALVRLLERMGHWTLKNWKYFFCHNVITALLLCSPCNDADIEHACSFTCTFCGDLKLQYVSTWTTTRTRRTGTTGRPSLSILSADLVYALSLTPAESSAAGNSCLGAHMQ